MPTLEELEDRIVEAERIAQRALDLIPLKGRGHVKERHIHKIIDGQGFLANDSFTRSNSTTVGTSESGHTWAEESGDWEIENNSLRVKALSGGASTLITLDVGSQDVGSMVIKFTSATAAGDIDVGVVFRFVDTNNFLLLQLVGDPTDQLRLLNYISGWSALQTDAVTPAGATDYVLTVDWDGPIVLGRLLDSNGKPLAQVIHDIPADTLSPFVGATKVGLRHNEKAGADTDRFDTFAARLGNAVATSQVVASTHDALTGVTTAQHHARYADAEAVSAVAATTDVSASSWVLDEDSMASDDATKVPTQQSVKAYTDGQAKQETYIPFGNEPEAGVTIFPS